MKIVIDIPEEVYNRCKEYRLQCGEAEVLESAVARGTPLPETNDGDLISRQEVSDIIKTRLYQTALNNDEYITSYAKVCEDIAENRIDTWINEAKSVKPEKCGDCISRQDLLNAIFQKEYGHDYDENTDILGLKYVDIIKRMPSVELERKHGHWIMQNDRSKKLLGWSFCSECNAWIGEPTDYCSCCGADMREGQNE